MGSPAPAIGPGTPQWAHGLGPAKAGSTAPTSASSIATKAIPFKIRSKISIPTTQIVPRVTLSAASDISRLVYEELYSQFRQMMSRAITSSVK